MSKIHFRHGKAFVLAAALAFSVSFAEALPPGSAEVSKASWRSDSVVYIAGLIDVKQNALGSLRIAPDDLVFSTNTVQALIPLSHITAVSIGDERVATGGAAAKVARKIPVFGFGAAMGAVTSKTVDVLTVEYQNGSSGYHGAVFEVPKRQAEIVLKQLSAFIGQNTDSTQPGCETTATLAPLLVAPIDVSEFDPPAEYRVLLYEQLVAELRKSYAGGPVLRFGDQDAGCASKTLHVAVTGFKKGNETLRSSTGPAGFFVGGTSFAIAVRLVASDGSSVFEKRLKSSNHGDSDSLNVTRDVAHSVAKRLAKVKSLGLNATAL